MKLNFRWVIYLLILLVAFSATAETKPPGYAEANASFSALKPDQRAFYEVLMTAAGYYNSVPVASFNSRLFNGIKQFQSEKGYEQSGILDSAQFDRLFSEAAKKFDLWGFELIKHPFRPIRIWVPVGLGITPTRNDTGIEWHDQDNRIRIDFTSVPNLSVGAHFGASLNALASDQATIHYKVRRRDWFVISFTTANGVDGYARYHQDGTSVTGFSLFWNNANGDVNGDRIATLMSGSLWAVMSGKPFPNPPRKNLSTVSAPNLPAQPSTTPIPDSKPSPPNAQFSNGTGFFVSTDGNFVTNAHVVEKCDEIKIKTSDGTVESAMLVNADAANDLALLKVPVTPKKVAKLRIGVRLGEGVAAFGYPHANLLSTSGNFTLGNVTALAGMGDDSRYFQISAPVQSGNSGGPLLDTSGNVVGVVSAKLNALKVALQGGDLTQNVNFAVKSIILATFLNTNSIAIQSGAVSEKPLESADLADRAKEISAFVLCKGP
jgi:S1-C subfamily serine protease